MIYAGSSVAIVTSEFISIKGAAVVDTEWSLITYSMISEPPFLEIRSLPTGWDARPFPLTTQEVGAKWAKSLRSVCLKVPSARILLKAYPKEHNLLINPLHPDFRRDIRLNSVSDMFFNLDEWATGGK